MLATFQSFHLSPSTSSLWGQVVPLITPRPTEEPQAVALERGGARCRGHRAVAGKGEMLGADLTARSILGGRVGPDREEAGDTSRRASGVESEGRLGQGSRRAEASSGI